MKAIIISLLFLFSFTSLAQIKVTDLPPIEQLSNADVLPVVDVSEFPARTKKVTIGQILSGASSPVTSVNEKIGDVVITKEDLELENVDNTSDLSKPISTATQTALDNKAPSLKNYPKVLPTLNLNFARDKVLDPKITFSRASARTCINEFGLIYNLEPDEPCFDHDPDTLESKGLLIEESRTNLLTHSNQFDNSAWNKNRVNIQQGAGTGPFGSLTAWRVIDTTEDNTHVLSYNFMPTGNTTYTMTVFVKYDEGSPIEHAQVMIGQFSQQVAPNTIVVNLKTGSFTATDYLRTRVTPINGGYLVSSTVTIIASPSIGILPQVSLHNGTSSSYAGTGNGSILVSDFQLEVGSSPTSTLPSVETFTSRASTATYIDSTGKIATAAINAPRYSYNPENLNIPPKLLLEGESTNLALWSEDLSNAYWHKQQVTLSTGSASPIEGVTYSKLVPSTSNATHQINRDFTSVPAGIHSFSFFAKSSGYNFVRLRLELDAAFASSFIVNLESGTVSGVLGSTPISATVQKFANGYRIAGTYTTSSTATHKLAAWVYDTAVSNGTFVGDGTSGIELTGINFTEGGLSSYIPTTSAPVTRSADVYTSAASTRAADLASITGANFSSWYNQNEGTFVVKASAIANTLTNRAIFRVSDNTINNVLLAMYPSTGSRVLIGVTKNNSSVFSRNYLIDDVTKDHISAIGYSGSLSRSAVDGVSGSHSGIGSMPTLRLDIGSTATESQPLNGRISHLRYYPKIVTDNEIMSVSDPEINEFLWAVGR